jgi:hypothetical protein
MTENRLLCLRDFATVLCLPTRCFVVERLGLSTVVNEARARPDALAGGGQYPTTWIRNEVTSLKELTIAYCVLYGPHAIFGWSLY